MEPSHPRGWLLYDGNCGFCRRFVFYWRETLQNHNIALAPLQSDWVREKLRLSEEELERDVRLLMDDGRQFLGANAYRQLFRLLGWTYPLYLVSIVPGLRQIFDWSYRTFADNRSRIVGGCSIR